MKFTFYGHNCFVFNHDDTILITDPWFSKSGAFFGSWFQWPINHDFLDILIKKTLNKNVFIYLSHEHQDHFDLDTLKKFSKKTSFIIPNYNDKFLINKINKLGFNTIELNDSQIFFLKDSFSIKLLIIDTGINHDSAAIISIKDKIFINQNDCKIYDRLLTLNNKINFYSVQYSGANWHPNSFKSFNEEEKKKVSKIKVQNKISSIVKVLDKLKPDYYLPAAGPAIFPLLKEDLSLGIDNIFIHQDTLKKYLSKINTNIIYLKPGDDFSKNKKQPIMPPTLSELKNLKSKLPDFWKNLKTILDKKKLIIEINKRLAEISDLKFHESSLIIFKWGKNKKDGITIDLNSFKAFDYIKDASKKFFLLEAEPKYFALMTNDNLRWQDIYLSLRASVTEEPPIFDNFVNIFVLSDVSNVRRGFLSVLEVSKERITKINPITKKKFTMKRYCPHNGSDLINADINEKNQLICPRHGWKFDLNNDGKCIVNNSSIESE
jgi:UDP-MurNAc hydroxylase